DVGAQERHHHHTEDGGEQHREVQVFCLQHEEAHASAGHRPREVDAPVLERERREEDEPDVVDGRGIHEGVGADPHRPDPCDRSVHQEEDDRHVDEGDRQSGETGQALGAHACPPDDGRCRPVGREEQEGRGDPPRDQETERDHERQKGGDRHQAKEVDLPRAPEPFLGERAFERDTGRIGRRHHHSPTEMGTKVSTGCARPASGAAVAAEKRMVSPADRRVTSDTRTGTPSTLVSSWRRAATLTASPIAVYSRRRGAPMSPTTTEPVWMPMPMRSGRWPRAARSVLSCASASCIARAQRTARAAWSGCATGAPKYAMRPSPRYLSRVPPWLKT